MTRLILLLALVAFSGCDFSAREEALRQKDSVLRKRESDLELRERLLVEAENQLKKSRQKIDSASRTDSSSFYQPALTGSWNTQMNCTETTCNESAVGDTKTERWDLYYERYTLKAKAFARNNLVRTYSGFVKDNVIELLGENPNQSDPVTIRVRLQMSDSANLSGQREINRENTCKVIYTLQMKRL